jgi:flagellar protein FliS
LANLSQSLDRRSGGDLCGRLAELYDYIARRVLEANFEQSDSGLAEAETLLRTLHEGWTGALAQQAVVSAAALPPTGYAPAHRWSA